MKLKIDHRRFHAFRRVGVLKMIIGYARVSTKKQSRDGNSLAGQERQIKEKYGNIKVYKEAYTGTKADRKVFNKVLSELEAGDTLVVTKLDRFCRNTKEGLEVIDKLLKRDVSIHILNMGMIDSTPTGHLIVTIFLAFAEFERQMIIERTQAGKEIQRQRLGKDFKEGRPRKYKQKQLDLAMKLLEECSYSQVSEQTGISISSIYREKQRRAAMNLENAV